MNDEQIIQNGGSETDIGKYANQNGADLTREDIYDKLTRLEVEDMFDFINMKNKCYKCKLRLADKSIEGVIYICNECCNELLKVAILTDYHNKGVKKRK